MNWFGHLALAWRRDPEPAFALGSALPDLARIAGCRRLPQLEASPLRDGITFHETVDEVFHALPSFLGLMADGAQALRDAGVRRGIARAASHVAVELHLDGVIGRDPAARVGIDRTLDWAAADALRHVLDWTDEDCAAWQRLRGRIRADALPQAWRDGDLVADRVIRALERRPRLRPSEREDRALRHELAAMRSTVLKAAPALLRALASKI